MLDLSMGFRLSWTVGLVVLALLARFFQRLHVHRSRMRGLPGPPHSYLFGSLMSMGKVLAKQPRRAAPQSFIIGLKEEYNLGDYFYVDSWPLGPQLLMISDADMASEIMLKQSPPKHELVETFMKNFGGPGNLVSSNGPEWKKWRSVFNPGFSSSHLMTLVPVIVDQCKIFCDIMQEHVRNNTLFRMEKATTKLTIDIICKLVLDVDLNSQQGPNELVDAFNSQVHWQALGVQFQPSELWDIRRPIVQAWNNWRMIRYLGQRLDERFASRQQRGKTKHVIDLALEAYLKEVKGTSGDTSAIKQLDPDFRAGAISNMRTFVFAGHDTTSSTICYAYYYLQQNPEMMAKIRQEHDEVFGPAPSSVAAQLCAEPHLLNKLDYTLAITREVLRLLPPASTVRRSIPGFTLHDPATNEPVPVDGFMLWPVDVGLHRNEKYWPDPHTFNPDRFLPSDTANNRDAFVPFSKGPRNCIGQELAIIETKIILAMTLRSFDFVPAYHELSRLKGDGSGYPSDEAGVQEQFGEAAYQVQLGTAKPRESMPCRLKAR